MSHKVYRALHPPQRTARDRPSLLVQFAAIPFSPAAAGRLPAVPKSVRVPLVGCIANMPTAPVPAFRVYRNFPSALTVISIFDEPVGLSARTVPGSGVSAPPLPIANPDTDPEPAFDT